MLRILFLILISPLALCQSIPGLQFVKPNPNDGRPLLVATPCAEEETWEIPIRVYADADKEEFIDRSCLIASAHRFDQTGEFMVGLFFYYKRDYPCRKKDGLFPPEAQKAVPTFSQDCKNVGYKMLWLVVDTRAKLSRATKNVFLDVNGSHFASGPADNKWWPFDKLSPSARTATQNITRTMQKEVQYEKKSGRF